MLFDVITIFPEIIDAYIKEGVVNRGIKKKIIEVRPIFLRNFTNDSHKTVDDSPYGGGPGMVLKVEPIFKAVQYAKKRLKNKKTKVILFSARGKKFNQKMAKSLARYDHLIFICGRYEGVDERVAKYIADQEISVGDYILSGGELPALILIDAISRIVPNVLGNENSIEEKRIENFNFFKENMKTNIFFSYPVYTRPEKFCFKKNNKIVCWQVPKTLLSGNHKEIERWRIENLKKLTKN